MATTRVRNLVRFSVPRSEEAPMLTPEEVVDSPVSAVGLYWFDPVNVFRQKGAELTFWRDQPLPLPGYSSGLMNGRIAAFRKGLLYVPDRFGARLFDASAFALSGIASILPMVLEDFRYKTAGAEDKLVELIDEGGEIVEELLERVHMLPRSRPTYGEFVRSLLTKDFPKAGLALPFLDLVDVSIDVAPSYALLLKPLGITENFMTLTFSAPSRPELRLVFSMTGSDPDSGEPHFPVGRKYAKHKDKKLAEGENLNRIALGFMRARGIAEIHAFAERIPNVRRVALEDGLADEVVPTSEEWAEVAGAIASTVERFAQLPFAEYGLSNPLAGLRRVLAR